MSGIYGTTITYDTKVIETKLNFIKFRGKDYSQIKNFNLMGYNLTLGYNGNLISNNDSFQNQPFEYKKRFYAIFDGIISNRDEIKMKFSIVDDDCYKSDVAILCQLYEKIGDKCVSAINGNFAFVIYDSHNQCIFGARDRLGIKPFFYHHSPKGFEFCSQLRPISYSNNFTINISARKFYWIHQYIPDPISIYEEVRKIKAGHKFNYNIVENSLTIEKYWDIHDNTDGFIKPKSYNEALETIDHMLHDSISKSVYGKSSSAVYLSGGIDSSLIASYLSKTDSKLEAFSVGFEVESFDESFYAREVAKQLNVKYNQLICNSSDALSIIENLNEYYDEPMADLSAIATAFLSREVSNNFSVSFGGDGGDEVFWGYDHYLLLHKIMRTPFFLRNLGSHILKISHYKPYVELLKQKHAKDIIAKILLIPFMNTYKGVLNYDSSQYLFIENDLEYVLNCPNKYQVFSDLDLMSRCVYAFNTKVERANEYFGVEFNAPFMDHKIVEYTKQLPLSYLYKNDIGQKRILRDLLYKDLNKNLFNRPKKGFGVPYGYWLRNEMKDMLYASINSNTLKELNELNVDSVISLRDRHMSGDIYAADFLWRIINYFNWSKSVGL